MPWLYLDGFYNDSSVESAVVRINKGHCTLGHRMNLTMDYSQVIRNCSNLTKWGQLCPTCGICRRVNTYKNWKYWSKEIDKNVGKLICVSQVQYFLKYSGVVFSSLLSKFPCLFFNCSGEYYIFLWQIMLSVSGRSQFLEFGTHLLKKWFKKWRKVSWYISKSYI